MIYHSISGHWSWAMLHIDGSHLCNFLLLAFLCPLAELASGRLESWEVGHGGDNFEKHWVKPPIPKILMFTKYLPLSFLILFQDTNFYLPRWNSLQTVPILQLHPTTNSIIYYKLSLGIKNNNNNNCKNELIG